MLKPGQTSKGIQEKSQRLKQGLFERRAYLCKIVDLLRSGMPLPEDCFVPNANKSAIREWHDPDNGILRMSVGTFNKYPKISSELLEIARTIHDLRNTKRSRSGRKSRADVERLLRYEREKTQVLHDELFTLRQAYLDLLGLLESDAQISRHRQHAIRRHRQLFGALRPVDNNRSSQ